jgi:hypothetical protein
MPKRPKSPNRPVDVIGGLAAFPADDGKDKIAQLLGQRGGAARAKTLSPKRRSEIARQAAAKRWGKK